MNGKIPSGVERRPPTALEVMEMARAVVAHKAPELLTTALRKATPGKGLAPLVEAGARVLSQIVGDPLTNMARGIVFSFESVTEGVAPQHVTLALGDVPPVLATCVLVADIEDDETRETLETAGQTHVVTMLYPLRVTMRDRKPTDALVKP